jgi:DNA repair ATPase RecN
MAEPSREDRPEYLGPLSEDEAEMAHLEARVVELTAAFRRYGEHDDECPRWQNQAQECTCGLDAALAAAGEGEDSLITEIDKALKLPQDRAYATIVTLMKNHRRSNA